MPTKTAIKSLIRAIRNGQDADVKKMIEADPDLTNCYTSAPPKKDDGQSPLQIAFKTGRFAIADFLIDHGADVNFIEESNINDWKAPVIHDAIRATAFNMRVAHNGSKTSFATAIAMLKKLLRKGADPNATDSYGNHCLARAILDLRIQLTSIPLTDSAATESHAVFDEDARELLDLLLAHGADIHASNATRNSAFDQSRGTYFERFLSDQDVQN
jgi:ankyrin repeat protein